jgi:hypothetical protein
MRAQTRDLLPTESFVFPTCSGGGAQPLPNTPDQTVERDWQAMPRAEPALSRAYSLRK